MSDADDSPHPRAVLPLSLRERNPPVRQLFLALLGVAATVGTVSAQAPWSPSPLAPPAFPRHTVSPASMNEVVPAGGCSTCAPSAAVAGLYSRVVASPLTIGQGCANNPGCGSFASERTFLFGGCNQFFNAGNKCGRGGCGTGNGSAGGFGDTTPCKYGSYLNR